MHALQKSLVDLVIFHSFQQKRNLKKRLKICQPSRIISAVKTQSSERAGGVIITPRSRLQNGATQEYTNLKINLKHI